MFNLLEKTESQIPFTDYISYAIKNIYICKPK